MSRKDHKSLADESMLDLFRLEVEQQSAVLMEGLMRLEQGAPSSGSIEPLMRAAHSIKGAARLVGIMDAVGLAHELEDCLVAAQKGRLTLRPDDIDLLLKSVDMLASIASLTRDGEASLSVAQKAECSGLEASLGLMLNSDGKAKKQKTATTRPQKTTSTTKTKKRKRKRNRQKRRSRRRSPRPSPVRKRRSLRLCRRARVLLRHRRHRDRLKKPATPRSRSAAIYRTPRCSSCFASRSSSTARS